MPHTPDEFMPFPFFRRPQARLPAVATADCADALPRRLLRALGYAALTGYFIFVAIFLSLRYLVLPQIEHYRVDVEQALSAALKQPVSIQRIDADWQGLRPRLTLRHVDIKDKEGRPALHLENVEAVLGWRSVLYLEPRLHRLEIVSPELSIRRDVHGHITIAGLPLETDSSEPGALDWVLKQHELAVTHARIEWTDEMRGAPTLVLDQLGFQLDNNGSRHRFGLIAQPPKALAARLDIRGDMRGSDVSRLDTWSGQFYAELDYADLAVWQRWVDYPIRLPRGTGGLRLWLQMAGLRPVAATADVALADVDTRLAPDLPELHLRTLSGRLGGRELPGGFEVSTRGLSLITDEGIRLEPADVSVRYQPLEGEFHANRLDLSALARLAGHLPLPEGVRKALTDFAPGGRLKDFRASWNGRTSPTEHYRIAGTFQELTLNAHEGYPGASGISGNVDGNERSGTLQIDSSAATLDLPMVFAESRVPLDRLQVQARWKRTADALDLSLDRVSLANPDLEGSLKGEYRLPLAEGTHGGVIDLDGRFTRGEANAVWRYIPKVAPETASWLKTGLVAGRASDVILKLKGDLGHFPFRDGSGAFRVTLNAHGAAVRPGPSWPLIENVEGDLVFDGARMTINARQASILGTQVYGVVADLPDLESHKPVLSVSGKAKGETAGFLRFIEASPVGEMIDHFTDEMTAKGSGELDLKLVLPLAEIVKSRVEGVYRFDGNRIQVDPAMPPLEELRGKLEFTDTGLNAKDVKARGLGGPLSFDVRTVDGAVAVNARGELNVAQLRSQFPLQAFEHLSGTTRWDGTIRVKKKNPEIRIQSDLRGIASSLPEPFNKSAAETRALVVERKLVDSRSTRGGRAPVPPREQWDISLQKALRVQLLRGDGGKGSIEQGQVAIGANPLLRLPDRGILVQADLPRVDLDFWRTMMPRGSEGEQKSSANAPIQVDLHATEVVALGRGFHDIRLTGSERNERWNFDLKSREVSGHFDWNGEGRGRLAGRISQFSLPALQNAATPAANAPGGNDLDQLPALDLTFDRFVYAGRDFGELRIAAENRGGVWMGTFNSQAEDGSFSGEGRWKPDPSAPDTTLDFHLKTKSIESMLNRIGYPNAVKRGTAAIEGKLSWNGTPFAPDVPSLNGTVTFQAKDGQFRKLEPGMGRVLGILSLQSLPRRITLDFRDIFSEGFAFDSIEGKALVTRGVAQTDDLTIRGPAAQVAMKGSVDLAKETQNLTVRVQPALGESVATGVLFLHPVTGITTWAVNKLFGRPLDQIFAFEYAITGSWEDPKVEKLGGNAPKAKPAAAKDDAAASETAKEGSSQ